MKDPALLYDWTGVEIQAKVARRFPWWPVTLFIIGVGSFLLAATGAFRPKDPPTIGGLGGGTITSAYGFVMTQTIDQEPVEEIITGGHYYDALLAAVKLWEVSLGRSVTIPELVTKGKCSTRDAAACAFPERYVINVADVSGTDLTTIMMHEVGHLLGVPHIEGDQLMDGLYHGKVSVPTPAACALARLSLAGSQAFLCGSRGK